MNFSHAIMQSKTMNIFLLWRIITQIKQVHKYNEKNNQILYMVYMQVIAWHILYQGMPAWLHDFHIFWNSGEMHVIFW